MTTRALITFLSIGAIIALITYTVIGTSGNVDEIKRRVPLEIPQRNWTILRYEGYEYGSWNIHGGRVWYHVCNTDNTNIQYRVGVALWNNELQWYYKEPEILNRTEIKINNTK